MKTHPTLRRHDIDEPKFHPPVGLHPYSCLGCTLASPKWGVTRPIGRGDTVKTLGDGAGLYVGTSAAGVEWVAYPHNDFRSMCAAFDEEIRDAVATEARGSVAVCGHCSHWVTVDRGQVAVDHVDLRNGSACRGGGTSVDRRAARA